MALDQVKDDSNMSFLDHLDDLRKHLFRASIFVILGTVISFIYADFLVDIVLFAPTRSDFPTIKAFCSIGQKIYSDDRLCFKNISLNMQNIDVAGQFVYSFKMAFIGGIILAFPFIINQVWLFIKPALGPKEIRKTRFLTLYTSFLFFIGVLFGYFLLSPISLQFFVNYKLSPNIANNFSFQSVINLVSMLCLATGAIFQLPLLMYFLAKIGLITTQFLKKNRRYAIVIIVILAAIVTPPDVLSQFILVIPLLGLYEIGIIIVKKVEKNQKTAT